MLQAARQAFAESGYGVPLDEIAARAGVGPGTVYRHFPAKEALFEAVVTARITDLVSDARARADAPHPGEAFFGFLARIAAEAAAKRDLPDAISIAGSLREDLFAALDLLLRRAQQAGAVRDGIKTSDLIVLLKGPSSKRGIINLGNAKPRARRGPRSNFRRYPGCFSLSRPNTLTLFFLHIVE